MKPKLTELIESLLNWENLTRSEILLTMAKIHDELNKEKPEQRIVAPTNPTRHYQSL